MSECERNKYWRKKLVSRVCGPAKCFEEQCKQNTYSSIVP